MKIGPVNTAGSSRGGLGFYTNNATNSTTAPTLQLAIAKTGEIIIGDEDPNYNVYADTGKKLHVKGDQDLAGNTYTQALHSSGTANVAGITTLSDELFVHGKG